MVPLDRRDILALLKPTGIPAIYGWYEPGGEPERPYLALHYLYDSGFAADNSVYSPVQNWQLDLIADEKDEACEQAVQQALRSGGFFYAKEQVEDEGADYARVLYRFKTIGE